MNDCIFCKIITKKIPAKIVKEDDFCIVIEDISPKAPVHYLIIPKKHVENIAHLENDDLKLSGKILLMAKSLSDDLGSPSFNILSNNGKAAGQTVFHLHVHFLSGKNILGDQF